MIKKLGSKFIRIFIVLSFLWAALPPIVIRFRLKAPNSKCEGLSFYLALFNFRFCRCEKHEANIIHIIINI
jgi:hypothetical protein